MHGSLIRSSLDYKIMQKTKQNFKLTIRGFKVIVENGQVIVGNHIKRTGKTGFVEFMPTERLIKILLYLKSEGFV